MLLSHARSILFLPASNARAIEKARTLPCDMIVLDLEDSVPDADKPAARDALKAALVQGFGDRLVGIRINPVDSAHYPADLSALSGQSPDYVVLPKVEAAVEIASLHAAMRCPVIGMIESPRGVVQAENIAAEKGIAALFMGNNDLRRDLRIPLDAGRQGLAYAMQRVILAARLAGIAVFDGVYNRLDDPDGLIAECAEARTLGFDGKTLIHPNQIAIANASFGPTAEDLAAARALVAAATGGAERYQGAMIETMHVEQAQALLDRAEALSQQA